jgi:hypothetical protein
VVSIITVIMKKTKKGRATETKKGAKTAGKEDRIAVGKKTAAPAGRRVPAGAPPAGQNHAFAACGCSTFAP